MDFRLHSRYPSDIFVAEADPMWNGTAKFARRKAAREARWQAAHASFLFVSVPPSNLRFASISFGVGSSAAQRTARPCASAGGPSAPVGRSSANAGIEPG